MLLSFELSNGDKVWLNVQAIQAVVAKANDLIDIRTTIKDPDHDAVERIILAGSK